jgi:hypothetical protein
MIERRVAVSAIFSVCRAGTRRGPGGKRWFLACSVIAECGGSARPLQRSGRHPTFFSPDTE